MIQALGLIMVLAGGFLFGVSISLAFVTYLRRKGYLAWRENY